MATQLSTRPVARAVDPSRPLAVVLTALAATMATSSLLGPLGADLMRYRTSPTTMHQMVGGDAAALFVVAPLAVGVAGYALRPGRHRPGVPAAAGQCGAVLPAAAGRLPARRGDAGARLAALPPHPPRRRTRSPEPPALTRRAGRGHVGRAARAYVTATTRSLPAALADDGLMTRAVPLDGPWRVRQTVQTSLAEVGCMWCAPRRRSCLAGRIRRATEGVDHGRPSVGRHLMAGAEEAGVVEGDARLSE